MTEDLEKMKAVIETAMNSYSKFLLSELLHEENGMDASELAKLKENNKKLLDNVRRMIKLYVEKREAVE